jgi:hypothetical protein
MSIEILCKYGELVPLSELKDHPKNPNVHSDEQIKRLAGLIKQHGWRTCVVVSKLSGYIVCGHARFQAAQLLGCDVPVDYQEFDSEEMELAHLVADNQISELSSFHPHKLKDLYESVKSEVSLESLGMTETDLQGILEEYFEPNFDPQKGSKDVTAKDVNMAMKHLEGTFLNRYTETEDVTCPKCEDVFKVNKRDVV